MTGGLLILLSLALYLVHFAIFRDSHHIWIYMLGDIAFLPIEVLLVTLIVDRVLARREKRSRMEKLNMVIGAFFSEVGSQLLAFLTAFDAKCGDIKDRLLLTTEWKEDDFRFAGASLAGHECMIQRDDENLLELRLFLMSKHDIMLAMLENPNLLEHETFTDLLWAVFHLMDELKYRDMLEGLPETDHQHLCGDIGRVYGLLIREWLIYMKHLQHDYPYLYSLAVRTNPFNPEASPIVE